MFCCESNNTFCPKNLQLHIGAQLAQLDDVAVKEDGDFFAEHSSENNNNGFFNQDAPSVPSEKVSWICFVLYIFVMNKFC